MCYRKRVFLSEVRMQCIFAASLIQRSFIAPIIFASPPPPDGRISLSSSSSVPRPLLPVSTPLISVGDGILCSSLLDGYFSSQLVANEHQQPAKSMKYSFVNISMKPSTYCTASTLMIHAKVMTSWEGIHSWGTCVCSSDQTANDSIERWMQDGPEK